jgi:uncharacterized protein with von Willebrand factor type A (vWA) domain
MRCCAESIEERDRLREGKRLILIMKANEMHYFSDLFDEVLYMFRTYLSC